jgi:hypothetical protein
MLLMSLGHFVFSIIHTIQHVMDLTGVVGMA